MKRVKERLGRDALGVIKGHLLYALLLVLSGILFMGAFRIYDETLHIERSLNAAQEVVRAFGSLINAGLESTTDAANRIEAQGEDAQMVLQRMVAEDGFEDAAIIAGDAFVHADGSNAPVQDVSANPHYNLGGSANRVIAQDDGALQLRVDMNDAGELVAWIGTDTIRSVFESAFDAPYGYAVYNSATGFYLINEIGISENSYYDTLMLLNDEGQVESLLKSRDSKTAVHISYNGRKYCIAQIESQLKPWSIALFIPDDLLNSNSLLVRLLPHLGITMILLLLVVLFVRTLFSIRLVRRERIQRERADRLNHSMLYVSALESRTTMFIYCRRKDAPMPVFDGLNLLGKSMDKNAETTLNALIKACDLEEEDAQQLINRMRELAAGGTAELVLNGFVQEQNESRLRFLLNASEDDKDTVIINIYDYSERVIAENRADEERAFCASVESRTSSIWYINVSKNRWELLKAKHPNTYQTMNIFEKTPRDFLQDLNALMRDHIHPEDYDNVVEVLGLPSLTAMYHSGRFQFTMEYRTTDREKKNFIWHRMNGRISVNLENGDIIANLYVFNVDAEKRAEMERMERKRIVHQTLTALGGMYYGLYYVDLDKDLCYTAKSRGGELISKLCGPYKATFDEYILHSVHPEDQAAFRNMTDPYHLHKTMAEGSHCQSMQYRRIVDDTYECASLFIQPARFENGAVRDVVVALSNSQCALDPKG